jgi:tetratricopeptide (TPR) repeat protein
MMEKQKMRIILFGIFTSIVLMFATSCESQEFVSAKMYLQQDNLELAEEWFLKAMELEAEASNAEIPFALATNVYAVQKRYEEMSAMLDEALARNADQKVGNYTIKELVLNTRQIEWQTNYKYGSTIYNRVVDETQGVDLADDQRTDLEEAKKFFEVAIMIWPEEGATYPNLVYCNRMLGDKDAEAEALQTALTKDPGNGIILMLAGEEQADAGNLDGAIDYFKKAYEQLPDNMAIMQHLTGAYLKNGNTAAALEILEETQKLAPNDPDISFNIGAVYENIGNSALRLGQDLYRDAVTTENVNASNLEEAVEYFKQAQNAYSEALYFLDNSLALNPDDVAAGQALSAIQARKKILDTIQRSAEDILREAK